MVRVTGGGWRTIIWTLTLFKEKRIITLMMKVRRQQSIRFNFIYRAAVIVKTVCRHVTETLMVGCVTCDQTETHTC